MLVVGGIIGGGIFFTPADVARSLPDGGWILAIWALGGVVALAGALTYAELGAMLPDAGGPYVYIREAFGEPAAFLYGWMLLTSIATGAAAAVALAFANYLGRMGYVDLARVGGPVPVAAAVLAALTITNYFGIKPGAAVQNGLTIAKTVALLLLIAAGLAAWGRLAEPPPVPAEPAPASLLAGLAAAFVPVLFSIGGWQQMNMVGAEVRRPERLIPRALFLGIAVVIACYVGANAVYLRALGRDGLAASPAVAADAAARVAGPLGATVISLAAMLSILGIVNVVLLATPRVFYAMARDGVFFEFAGRVHPRFGAPHVSVAFMGGWSIVLLLAAGGRIGDLLNGVVFADWIFFGLGAASVFALRRRRPDAERPYRAWGYPVVPGFFVLAAVVAVASAVASAPATSLRGVGLLAVGALLYGAFARRRTRG